jgi:AraC-like DNA-binding protein
MRQAELYAGKSYDNLHSSRKWDVTDNSKKPRLWMQYYDLMSRYRRMSGNFTEALRYADSSAVARTRYDEKFNLRKLHYAEIHAREQEYEAAKERHRANILFALCGCVLLAIALGFYIFYSRAIRRKNKRLYLQIKEHDRLREAYEAAIMRTEQPKPTAGDNMDDSDGDDSTDAQKETVEEKAPGSLQQQKLVLRLREYLLENKNYVNPDINRDEIIIALATNRAYLYDALKTVTGKSLMEYIYFLRLEEARLILDGASEYTIEAVAIDCGFNTYRNFIRLFHKQYRITPSAYRKLAGVSF